MVYNCSRIGDRKARPATDRAQAVSVLATDRRPRSAIEISRISILRTEDQPRRFIDEPIAVTLLWTMLNGVGDHLTSERRHLTPYSSEALITFTARTLAAGLLTSATISVD
jgi:hypothetical protein